MAVKDTEYGGDENLLRHDGENTREIERVEVIQEESGLRWEYDPELSDPEDKPSRTRRIVSLLSAASVSLPILCALGLLGAQISPFLGDLAGTEAIVRVDDAMKKAFRLSVKQLVLLS